MSNYRCPIVGVAPPECNRRCGINCSPLLLTWVICHRKWIMEFRTFYLHLNFNSWNSDTVNLLLSSIQQTKRCILAKIWKKLHIVEFELVPKLRKLFPNFQRTCTHSLILLSLLTNIWQTVAMVYMNIKGSSWQCSDISTPLLFRRHMHQKVVRVLTSIISW